jgi:hypothetical protein
MSESYMAADESDKDISGMPKIRTEEVEQWARDAKTYLMGQKRNHKGLEDQPAAPGVGMHLANVRIKWEKDLEVWRERNDTCVSKLYEAVKGEARAKLVADQYLREKEALPDNALDKDPLAKDLMTRLINRFKEEDQDTLRILNGKFSQFKVLPEEKLVYTAVDRLNGIIQQLDQHGQPPSDEAKLSKLQEAIRISRLEKLWVAVALQANLTYDQLCQTCKRFDKANEDATSTEEVFFTRDEDKKTVCSYCDKIGHSAAVCYKKERDKAAAKRKRKGRAEEKTGVTGQKPGSKDYDGCHNCGKLDHLQSDCPKRKKQSHGKKPNKKKKGSSNPRDFVDSDDSDDSEANMIFSNDLVEMEEEEVLHSEFEERVYLDSCASKNLFLVKDQSELEVFSHESGAIGTTRAGASLETQGIGSFKDWKGIRVCNDAVKNLVSGGALRAMGYGLWLLHVPRIVKMSNPMDTVLTAEYSENGMPFVNLRELLHLPDLTKETQELAMLSDDMGVDKLNLLHRRLTHVSKSVLLEAYRRMLFEGSGLTRDYLSKKAQKAVSKFLCGGCAKGKITRRSFADASDYGMFNETSFLGMLTVDISVYLNCPSRQGYRYILVFTDVATKYFWRFPLKDRSGEEVLRCVKELVEIHFRRFPGEHRLARYHADGGKELLDQRVKEYLLSKFGTAITWSSTDTPELNAVSERKFRTLGERTLATLASSGLPKSTWWDAYDYVCDVTLVMPTKTHKGWMSPYECVPGGRVPNISRFRTWGCKSYVLNPKADRRKDWEDKSCVGYFIGHSKTKAGYKVLIGDTVVTSVHVLFDESIPERGAEYFKELDEATVKVDPEERRVSDFKYLEGRHHMDEGLLFITTRIVERKGLIVGFRALVASGKTQIEDKTPIHVADLQEMTEQLAKRLAVNAGPHDDETRDVPSRAAATELALPNVEPDATSGESPPAEPTVEKRKRSPRLLTNVAVLGEIHHVDDASEIHFLRAADDDMIPDLIEDDSSDEEDADIEKGGSFAPEPETDAQSRTGRERKYWSRARRNERHGLEKRKVLEVKPIPPGVKPIKSKYVYKRKFKKDGSIKKYKARMVALGYGQVAGVDVFNTFAPVVKGITIRLLIALAFIFNLHIHQLDVSNAFCYADVEGDVYMQPTPDYKLPEGHCFKLKKALYGLRNSPRLWWKHLDKFIKSLHFKPCVLEPCLYHMQYKGTTMYLTIYVDDILILSSNLTHINEVKEMFCNRFDMTDLGELEHFLNVRVLRTKKFIRMDQSVYIEKVLAKHAAHLGTSSKTKRTPLPEAAMDLIGQEARDSTPISSDDQAFLDNFPYRSLLGAVLYLSMNTRPDVAYAVGVLSRFANKVTVVTCQLMVHLMQYLRGTMEKGIKFSGTKFDLHIFSDADWAGDQLSRRSTTGYVVFAAGGPIAWQSKLQTTVATSSMQSEYQALYAGMQELVWLRGVMSELNMPLSEPTPFFLDSQSAQDLATNPVYHKRSKHVEIKYHWVREHVNPEGEYRTAEMCHVDSENQSADMYTKSLSAPKLEKHVARNLGEKRKSSSSIRADNSIKRVRR